MIKITFRNNLQNQNNPNLLNLPYNNENPKDEMMEKIKMIYTNDLGDKNDIQNNDTLHTPYKENKSIFSCFSFKINTNLFKTNNNVIVEFDNEKKEIILKLGKKENILNSSSMILTFLSVNGKNLIDDDKIDIIKEMFFINGSQKTSNIILDNYIENFIDIFENIQLENYHYDKDIYDLVKTYIFSTCNLLLTKIRKLENKEMYEKLKSRINKKMQIMN